jgi:hypothetical protein
MPEQSVPWFIAGVVVGITGWEILKAIAKVAFNHRLTILGAIVVILAVVGLIALFQFVTNQECRDACTPNVSGLSAPPPSQP